MWCLRVWGLRKVSKEFCSKGSWTGCVGRVEFCRIDPQRWATTDFEFWCEKGGVFGEKFFNFLGQGFISSSHLVR